MSTIERFPFNAALTELRKPDALPAWLLQLTSDVTTPFDVAASLAVLLTTYQGTCKAAADTTMVADDLRRYQKFAKPGKPSPHIVQLRQQQARARQDTNIARQALIKAAGAFVRDAGITVPATTSLEVFIVEWIDRHVPRDEARA